MVAKSTLITITIISAEGLVLLQQKRGVIDEGLRNEIAQHTTNKDVVNTLPLPLIAVRPLSAVTAACLTSDIDESLLLQILQRRTVVIVVEIASNNNFCILWQFPDNLHNSFHHHPTVRPRRMLTAKPARRMNHEHMQRIAPAASPSDIPAVQGFPLNIKHVARWSHSFQRLHLQIITAQRPERHRLVQQCNIYPSDVRRLRHQVFIPCMPQQRTSRQIKDDAIVLHFHQCHEVGYSVILTRQYLLPDAVHLAPITCGSPITY